MSHRRSVDDEICPRCNKPYDGYGHAADVCNCLGEIPGTPQSPSSPLMLKAEDWIALNAKRVEGEAEVHVLAFMRQIQDGLNPWGDQKQYQLKGEPVQTDVAKSICVRLAEFGFESVKSPATSSAGSQSCSLWHVTVLKPLPK